MSRSNTRAGGSRLGILAGVLTLASAALASPVAASITPVEPSTGQSATITVSTTAWVHPGGGGVIWPVVIRCPKGRAYTTTALLSERDPAAIPEMFGDDVGINARPAKERAGTCTGGKQLLVLNLPTQPVHFYHFPTDTWIDGYYPIHASTQTNAQLTLTGKGFSALYCAAPACAEETGPRVRLR